MNLRPLRWKDRRGIFADVWQTYDDGNRWRLPFAPEEAQPRLAGAGHIYRAAIKRGESHKRALAACSKHIDRATRGIV